jgi:hypothetical protein
LFHCEFSSISVKTSKKYAYLSLTDITEKEGKEGFSCKRRTKKDALKKQGKKKDVCEA